VKPLKIKKFGRHKLLIAIGIFAAAALVSSVYAMSSGWIIMQGVVARTENIDVRFVNARFVGTPRIGEFTAISAADSQRSFSITAQLMMPGDVREVAFQIRNTGNQAVRLLNLQSVYEETEISGLSVIWPDDNPDSPDLTNFVLVSGATSDTFIIRIGWDSNYPDVPTGMFKTFTLTMDYQNALLPIGGS
jgi:hypothetical protein